MLSDEKINEYLPLVRQIAFKIIRKFPPTSILDMDDLVQIGMVGLLDAFSKYEDMGHKFSTYAQARIKGAIMDEVRSLANVPRSMRIAIRELKSAEQTLEGELCRKPNPKEVAERLGKTIDEYFKTASSGVSIVSIEDCVEEVTNQVHEGEDDPLSILLKKDRARIVTSKISTLSENQQLALKYYYDERLSLKATGRALGVSESRVCQILEIATERLKNEVNC